MLVEAQLHIYVSATRIKLYQAFDCLYTQKGISIIYVRLHLPQFCFLQSGIVDFVLFERMNIRGACLIKDKPIPKTYRSNAMTEA